MSTHEDPQITSNSETKVFTTSSEKARLAVSDLDDLFSSANFKSVLEMTCEDKALTLKTSATAARGLFRAYVSQTDSMSWTCYRRNYFTVVCRLELHAGFAQGEIKLHRSSSAARVKAMGLKLSACTFGNDPTYVELTQQAYKKRELPRNDAGIGIVEVIPALSAVGGQVARIASTSEVNQIPMTSPDTSSELCSRQYRDPERDCIVTGWTFERVQYKHATTNSGTRNATQQFFRLVIEVFADIRGQDSEEPVWIKVAQQFSDKIIVRGAQPRRFRQSRLAGSTRLSTSLQL